MPDIPGWLPDGAVPYWNDLAPKLAEDGLLNDRYKMAFSVLCYLMAKVEHHESELKVCGEVSVSDRGAEYQHPRVGMLNQAIKMLNSMLREIGLTPSSANGLGRSVGEGPSNGIKNKVNVRNFKVVSWA